MDLSKLPKFSQTPSPPPQTASEADQAPFTVRASAPTGIGPEFWFNVVVGLLLLFLGRQFGVYAVDRLVGREFHSGYFTYWNSEQDHGPEITYPNLLSHVMLTEGGIFLFGLVVLLEAALRALSGLGYRIPATVSWAVFALAVISTGFNLYVCCIFISEGTTPLISGLAVAFGGFIMADIWRMSRANLHAKSF